jgi:hypothetical protein
MVAADSHTPEQGAVLVDALIFIGVIVLLVGGTMSAALWLTRARRGQARVVLLGVAGGEAEARLWAGRLRSVGIRAHVRQVGDLLTGDLTMPGGTGPAGYEYEVWVRPRDEARARKALEL